LTGVLTLLFAAGTILVLAAINCLYTPHWVVRALVGISFADVLRIRWNALRGRYRGLRRQSEPPPAWT